MSISNLFNGGSYIDQQIIKTHTHLTTELKYQTPTNSIKHYIDDLGHHIINESSGTKLLSYGFDDTLNDCVTKQHITDAVFNVSIGNISLQSILRTSNDAGQLTLSNLSSVQTNDIMLYDGSGTISVKNALDSHDTRLTSLETSGVSSSVTSQITALNAQVSALSGQITTLNNRIVSLNQYIAKLRALMSVMSKSISLTNVDGTPFNWDGY
jgi:hypothetical protein